MTTNKLVEDFNSGCKYFDKFGEYSIRVGSKALWHKDSSELFKMYCEHKAKKGE